MPELSRRDRMIAKGYEACFRHSPVYSGVIALVIDPGQQSEETIQIAAFTGRSAYQRAGDAIVADLVVRDFLVRAADLVRPSTGDRFEPAEGMVIRETFRLSAEADAVREFIVMPPGSAEPAWKYSDPARLYIRMHTKEIGDAEEGGES